MAIFNPEVGGVPSANMPDQTGASRGSIPNEGLGAALEGVGDIFEGAVELYDTSTKASIRQDARKGYDEEMKIYTDTVPVELTNGTSSIRTLQTAFEQGKISDVYFYGQLTSLSKSLRTKYPGYEGYVDEAIQSITGVRPANAYRNAILQEYATAEAAAEKEVDRQRQWEKENEKYIGVYFPDYFDNPDKYDFNAVRSTVVREKARLQEIDAAKSEIELQVNQKKVNVESVKETATTALNTTVNSYMQGMNNGSGLNGNDIFKRIMEMQSTGPTPEEYNQLLVDLNTLEATIKLSLNNQMSAALTPGSSNSMSSVIADANTTKNMIEQAMAPFYAIKEMVTNKEYGLASYYTNLNAITGQKALNDILNASPETRYAMALREVDPKLSEIYWTESGNYDTLFTNVIPELVARTNKGIDDFNDQNTRIAESSGSAEERAATINANINTHLASITSGLLSEEDFNRTVKSAYALDTDGKDVFNYVNPDEYDKLWLRMFNPIVTNAISASGDKEALSIYFNAAKDRMFPAFRKYAGVLSESNAEWSKYFEISVNDDGRLSLNTLQHSVELGENFFPPIIRDLTEDLEMRLDKKMATEAVNQVNVVFDTIGSIAEELGVSPADKPALFNQLLKEMNVTLEAGEQDGFFKWLQGSVDSIAKGVEGTAEFFDTSDLAFQLTNSISQNENPNDLALAAEPSPENLEKYLATTSAEDPIRMAAAGTPIAVARAYLGSTESNKEDVNVISAFIKKNAGIDINPKTTAWCAAFLDAVLHGSGSSGTGALNARSYLSWGKNVDEPQVGDVVVLSRPGGAAWQGHVGLFAGFDEEGKIRVLGGNQDDSVSVKSFPTDQVLAFRRAT